MNNLRHALLPSLLTLTLIHGAVSAVAQGPNVILIITDDQGYGDVGAHGNAMIQTPHTDRLHAQSVRLTDYHVDPTCAPTRSALLTGRYSTRTGVWHTILGRSLMNTDEVTLAEALQKSGYTTGMFGKWHLGDNYPLRPQDQGFDHVVMHGGGGVQQTPDAWGNDYFDDRYWKNGVLTRYEGYCTDVWFNEALDFIESSKDKPFFAYISTNAPHSPFFIDQSYEQPYLDKGVAPTMAKFYGMITNIDDNLGRLMDRLDETGLANNTILIFTTDNGTAAGLLRNNERSHWKGFNDGMRGTKSSQYDGGHRVPFFIRWPGGAIGGGRDVNRLTAHIDVMPTLLELCSVKAPRGVDIDGRSLAPLLSNPNAPWPDRVVFVHSQRIEYPRKWKTPAVMTDKWRLIDGKELYNMSADPGQTNDLAYEFPVVAETLKAEYEAWWSDLSDVFDSYVPIVIGHDAENPARVTAHDWHYKAVPWNQNLVKQNNAWSGYWEIEIARRGTYEFTLYQQDVEANHPLDADTAR
ncbi:MAG: arylsulfatase, partial [Planctomycetota bacterium]